MPTREQKKLLKVYRILFKRFGPQAWWPADTPFEVMVGAILTQNTNWKNVEKAIANLKGAKGLGTGGLGAEGLGKMNIRRLEELIRPSGYYRQKAKKLKAFVRFFLKEFGGSILKMKGVERADLLRVHGIGPETADSILLYALDRPTFVVDAYTKRIGSRVGLFKFEDYHEIKDYFEETLPKDLELYKEYHALLVELGKDYCKSRPECKNCPILKLCLRRNP